MRFQYACGMWYKDSGLVYDRQIDRDGWMDGWMDG